LRIIGGTARGRKLLSEPRAALRPMLDRVKEALFNILRDCTDGARALDLFSGTGSLGLEALSRGAESCVFVEKDPQLARLVERNAERCGLGERCHIVRADALALPGCVPPPAGLPADLIFVDPPYELVDDPNRRAGLFEALEELAGTWIAPGAVLALHHRPIPHALWPARKLREWDKRRYGRSQLTFFELGEEAADD